MKHRVLVFGYGNPGRQDDALGPKVVERLAHWWGKGVTLETDFQLNVEHAADVADHDRILFVDAAVSGKSPFQLQRTRSDATITFTTHSVAPASILAIAEECFQVVPRAWVLAIRGYEFELQEGLTAKAQDNLEQAVKLVDNLLRAWRTGRT